MLPPSIRHISYILNVVIAPDFGEVLLFQILVLNDAETFLDPLPDFFEIIIRLNLDY